jgi:hypothetical protein
MEGRADVGERDDLWMPTKVRGRADEFSLWRAFRRFVGIAWTGRDEDTFIAGWEAAMQHVRGKWDEVAEMLAENDKCGPGPVSEVEYRDDAAAILDLVTERRPSAATNQNVGGER